MTDETEAYPYHEGFWTSSAAKCWLDGMTLILLDDRKGERDGILTGVSTNSYISKP